jgi:VWFA-related protein
MRHQDSRFGAGRPRSRQGTGRRAGIVVLVFGLVSVLAAGGAAQQPAGAQQNPQTPRFRSSVEVTSIDVAVVDGQGVPLMNLTPADFTVRVDGKARSVVTAEWVPLAETSTGAKPPTRIPEGYSSNENATGGRLIAIAVDEPHIRPGGASAVLAAASAFIDRLSPADRIAVVSLGVGGPATPFTADRARIKDAIGRMVGQRSPFKVTTITVTASEALEIGEGNRLTLDSVVARECSGLRTGSVALQACRQEVETEAGQLAEQLRQSSDTTIRALRDTLGAMQVLNGPKTLILMSEGFSVRDSLITNELGALAAATRTSIYALKLDNQLFEMMTSARAPLFEASLGRTDGLEQLASASRGTLYLVNGTGSQLFAHIESELSGYYLLGVESEAADRDNKPHQIRIDVSRRGATVRTRRQLLNVPADLNKPRTVTDAVNASLTAPLLMSGLPIRVTSFALRGPEQDKVQLLIRADVGTDYVGPRRAVVGYVIQDLSGKIVESRTVALGLAPALNGVPGALQYSGGGSVDPGEYTLKLAVAEGDRIGSVEHPIHARLTQAGDVSLSELMVGGPAESTELLRPTVGYTVNFGTVHGYLEAYGPSLDQVAATYEVAASPDGPALLTANVANRAAGGGRALFTQMMSVGKLPPGAYVLRAKVTSGGQPLKTMSRRFEIAPPAVLMTSAVGVGSPASSVSADLFLPVDDGALSRPFARDQALAPQTLEPFLKRVPTSTKRAFEQGLDELRKANYAGAVAQFKSAIRPDEDSTAALSYLGATFAAGGQPAEATSVWQTALVDGADLPQIYEWLADTLVRLKDFTAARSILEEAVGRWPSDARFARTLAFSYATLGKGRDAIRALDRYIADGHADPDLLSLGVEWIFRIHNNRIVAITPVADLAMARNYAAQYAKADGPKQALVQQWLDFLENEKR